MTRDELLAKIDEGWRDFRAKVRSLGRAGLATATPVGWTYHDLVAHAAAWEAFAIGALARDRADTLRPMTDADVDAFNARAVEERRHLASEALLGELDAAHNRLVAEVKKLSPDELADEKILRIVGSNTFYHYADHSGEFAP